ncbi:MAG: hypothetical protein U0271_00130 [Polyangiaceae bacterium]
MRLSLIALALALVACEKQASTEPATPVSYVAKLPPLSPIPAVSPDARRADTEPPSDTPPEPIQADELTGVSVWSAPLPPSGGLTALSPSDGGSILAASHDGALFRVTGNDVKSLGSSTCVDRGWPAMGDQSPFVAGIREHDGVIDLVGWVNRWGRSWAHTGYVSRRLSAGRWSCRDGDFPIDDTQWSGGVRWQTGHAWRDVDEISNDELGALPNTDVFWIWAPAGRARAWGLAQREEHPTLLDFDGVVWHRRPLPAAVSDVDALAASEDGEVWVAARTAAKRSIVVHWDGSAFRYVAVPADLKTSVAVVVKGEPWFLGTDRFYTVRDGRVLTMKAPIAPVVTFVSEKGEFWIGGTSLTEHRPETRRPSIWLSDLSDLRGALVRLATRTP